MSCVSRATVAQRKWQESVDDADVALSASSLLPNVSLVIDAGEMSNANACHFFGFRSRRCSLIQRFRVRGTLNAPKGWTWHLTHIRFLWCARAMHFQSHQHDFYLTPIVMLRNFSVFHFCACVCFSPFNWWNDSLRYRTTVTDLSLTKYHWQTELNPIFHRWIDAQLVLRWKLKAKSNFIFLNI